MSASNMTVEGRPLQLPASQFPATDSAVGEKRRSRILAFIEDWKVQVRGGLGRASVVVFILNMAVDATIFIYSVTFTVVSVVYMLVAAVVFALAPSGPIHDAVTAIMFLLMAPFALLIIAEFVGCVLGLGLGFFGMFEPIWRRPCPLSNVPLAFVGLVANAVILGFDLLFGAVVMASA